MINLKLELEKFLESNHNSKQFIDDNKDQIESNFKITYDLLISDLSCTEIRYLILNYPFNIKCVCGNNKSWRRNKYNDTCGDKACGKKLREKTCFERHGVKNYFEHESIISKNKDNNVAHERFEIKNKENLNKEYIIEHFIKDNMFDIYSFIEYFNYSNDCAPYRIIKSLGIDYTKYKGTSIAEKQLITFISSLSQSNIITNDRDILNPFELDIYIPHHNLGIEYNGLYWHSYGLNNVAEKQSNKLLQQNRHIEKTNIMEQLSSYHQLFQIFENEWTNLKKQDIWKSMILNRLGLNKTKIYARKCIIKEITTSESNTFIEDNHIQGIRNAPIKLGLYYNNELISIMTFGKPLDNNSIYEYELVRFCNKKYTNIIGGASKLLKYFEKNYKPKSILSYANRRWSKGDLYNKLGFTLSNISKPNKFIIKNNKLYNRIGFQKHKLENKLEIYNSDLSADDNIINNNYRIIWDCGNYVFIKNYNQQI